MAEKDPKQQTETGQQPKPATNSADAELSDEQLDQVAGGSLRIRFSDILVSG